MTWRNVHDGHDRELNKQDAKTTHDPKYMYMWVHLCVSPE